MSRIQAFIFAVFAASLATEVFAQAPPVRVMTFNIRFGTAADGENHWDKRKEFLVQTIKAFDPDLLGTQETLGFQRDYLAQNLSGYGVVGVGRDDGKEQGEMMALYYRQARFEKTAEGHFWLSEMPEKAGSKSWDSSLPRMVTWAKLQDKKNAAAQPIMFFNTHFDHRGPQARLESAKLIRSRIEALSKGSSVIVTGDFNSGEGSPPYKALFAAQDGHESPIVDCYRIAHPQRAEDEGTATGFKASSTKGTRIDWIGASRDWKVLEAKIDRTEREGRTPSDHFAVETVLKR
jgi:endonuclease/exonuclease/phosphatase family metal-dependent hydrolase